MVYAGFDPTSDSFHVGNLLILTSLVRSSIFGCTPITLIGEATAAVGDPSGHKYGITLAAIFNE
jgi:tyrosyl-tRNA synthetase